MCILAIVWVLAQFTVAFPPRAETDSTARPAIELKLAASKDSMRAGGEPVRLRLELWNKGKDDFVASHALVPITNAPGYLLIEVKRQDGKRFVLEAGEVLFSNQSLSEWWIRIAPGHYYGVEIPLDTKAYEDLKIPGRYQFTATYVSRGGTTPANIEWHIPARTVWKGELKSNSVCIRLFPSDKEPKEKRK